MGFLSQIPLQSERLEMSKMSRAQSRQYDDVGLMRVKARSWRLMSERSMMIRKSSIEVYKNVNFANILNGCGSGYRTSRLLLS